MKARIFAFVALLVGGCSSSSGDGTPVDVTGTYTGPVTNGANSCPGLWNTGNTNDATVTIAQSGAGVSIQVTGAAALFLVAGFGTNAFTGAASGNHVDASIIGSVSRTAGGCMYTSNGNLAADLNGNTLTGTIAYTPQPNGDPDCASMMVNGCSSLQTFSLTRPPK